MTATLKGESLSVCLMGTKETGREYEPKIDNFNNQHDYSSISGIVVPTLDPLNTNRDPFFKEKLVLTSL